MINTHYHHREKEGEIRVQQSQALLTFIEEKRASQVVVMGDLNARPHEQEIKMLKDAGLVDALEDLVPGYTSPSDGPEKRIDYILVSKDLEATEPLIPATTASDHLPVVVTVSGSGQRFPLRKQAGIIARPPNLKGYGKLGRSHR